MGLAIKWNELEVLNAVVKGASGLIKSDSEDKAKDVEQLITAGEKFVRAVISLDEQYIKAENEEEEQKLWELMEELVALIGGILKVVDEYLVDCKVKRRVSKEKLRLLKDLRTAYKYLAGEISIPLTDKEEGKSISWDDFRRELGLSG